jgi:hypothetical protein
VSPSSSQDQRLETEALRVYHRYATEVVEPLGLCPWAKRARLEGRVARRAVLQQQPTTKDVLAHVDAVAADTGLDIGLLLFPRFDIDLNSFRRFVGAIRQADAERFPVGGAPLYMAEFHPSAPLDRGSPARLVSFIRRTPDPTIQLVRRTILDAAREREHSGTMYLDPQELLLGRLPPPPSMPLHERIAESNYQTIEDFGFDRLSEIMDDIRCDRDLAYAEATSASADASFATDPNPVES